MAKNEHISIAAFRMEFIIKIDFTFSLFSFNSKEFSSQSNQEAITYIIMF